MGQSLEQKLEQAEARIAELTQSLSDNDNAAKALADAQAQVESLTTELESERAALAQTRKDLEGARQSIQSLNAKVEKLESERKSAEAKAAQMCASVGVTPAKVTPKGDSNASSENLMEQFKAIQSPAAQTAFYRKHREELNALMNQPAR